MVTSSKRNFPGIRAALAQEFCGFTGTLKAFKQIAPENETLQKSEIRFYSAYEIRRARLEIAARSKASAKKAMASDHGDDAYETPIINFRMSKGGTGKTTLAANTASCLALMGYRVLVIDADPQASLTALFGVDWAREEIVHIGNLMQVQATAKGKNTGVTAELDAAKISIYDNGMLDLIPADITMANIDTWLSTQVTREKVFKRFLDANREFFSRYDAIIIDSAPGTTLLTTALMYASKIVTAVAWLDGQSLRAMEVLASNISELNEAFKDEGVYISTHLIANGYHAGYQTCKDSLKSLQAQYGDALDDNVIPHAAGFMRQMSLYEDADSGPILEREPRSVGARAIIDLTKSLVRKYGISLSKDDVSPLSIIRKAAV